VYLTLATPSDAANAQACSKTWLKQRIPDAGYSTMPLSSQKRKESHLNCCFGGVGLSMRLDGKTNTRNKTNTLTTHVNSIVISGQIPALPRAASITGSDEGELCE